MARREHSSMCRGVYPGEYTRWRYARVSLVRRDLSRTVNPKLTVSLINRGTVLVDAEDGNVFTTTLGYLANSLTSLQCTDTGTLSLVYPRNHEGSTLNIIITHSLSFPLPLPLPPFLFSYSPFLHHFLFSLFTTAHTLRSLIDALRSFSSFIITFLILFFKHLYR